MIGVPAGGHAPRYPEQPLDAPDRAAMRRAITRVLEAHHPYPGVALDRHWNIVIANPAAQALMAQVPRRLLQPVANIVRIGLHPDGLAACTTNFPVWGRCMVGQLQRLADSGFDAQAQALLSEVCAYPNVRTLLAQPPPAAADDPLVLCELQLGAQRLSLFTTLATFGSPRDVLLAELTVELFYPANAATEAALRAPSGGCG